MEKIILDTCVFFDMVYVANVHKRYGITGVKEYVDLKISNMKDIVSKMKMYYTDEFKKMYNGEDEVYTAMNFKGYLYKKIDTYQKTIDMLIAKRDSKSTSFEERKAYNKQIHELIEQRKDIIAIKNDLKRRGIFDELKECFTTLGPALLYERYLNGDVRFYIPYTGYKEILRHIDDGSKKLYDNFFVLPKDQIDTLLNKCTLLSFKTTSGSNTLWDIAKQFRTPIAGEVNATPMGKDINTNFEHGDSKIAAAGALAGMPVITTNAKDYIFRDKFDKTETKRNHIKNVCNRNSITTDAYPYTLLEYLCGKSKEVTKEASMSSYKTTRAGFAGEIVF